MSSPEHKEKIWNYIKDIKVGMLTTLNGQDLHSRPMHLVQKDYDGTIWFYTRRSSEKVLEAIGSQSVCISFCDHDNNVHVSLTGTAYLNINQNMIDKFWNPFVGAWFPEGKEDPDIALLEIKIQSGEHWATEKGKVGQLWEIAKAHIINEMPDMGENQKFGS